MEITKKFTLTLNSHSLSDFQACEMRYGLGDLICIQPANEKLSFLKGAMVGRILQVYYHRKMKGRVPNPDISWTCALGRIDLLMRRFAKKMEMKDAQDCVKALMSYFRTYMSEDIKILAVEKGFSFILYEDDENLFTYEGRPDMVAIFSGDDPTVTDFKTQGMFYNYFPFNNQALGYCVAVNTFKFKYRYMVFTKDSPTRDQNILFTPIDIERWKQDTIKWYFRIKSAIQRKEFLRSWHCTEKWGTCEFNSICTAPSDSMRSWIIKRDFQIGELHRSW